MNEFNRHQRMLIKVASAVGSDLLKEVVFVGGCTTGLLLTDEFTKEQVRHTDDVDLIVHVVGKVEWAKLQGVLRKKGFRDEMNQDGPICAMKIGELRVDFMPDDEKILGFTNPWYAEALKTAQMYQLSDALTIQLVHPAYFIATKLAAYLGRGNNDPLGSQDMEDILSLVAGREELSAEIAQAPQDLQLYVAQQINSHMCNPNFDYAVHSAAGGNQDRVNLIFERLDQIKRVAE